MINEIKYKVYPYDKKTSKELCPYFIVKKEKLVKTVTFLAHEYPKALIMYEEIKEDNKLWKPIFPKKNKQSIKLS